MQYLIENTKYDLSYQELKILYSEFVLMSDKKFIKALPKALHLACIICFLKEIPTYICLSDKGIIHELTHLLEFGSESPDVNMKEVRELFNEQLKLA